METIKAKLPEKAKDIDIESIKAKIMEKAKDVKTKPPKTSTTTTTTTVASDAVSTVNVATESSNVENSVA